MEILKKTSVTKSIFDFTTEKLYETEFLERVMSKWNELKEKHNATQTIHYFFEFEGYLILAWFKLLKHIHVICVEETDDIVSVTNKATFIKLE